MEYILETRFVFLALLIELIDDFFDKRDIFLTGIKFSDGKKYLFGLISKVFVHQYVRWLLEKYIKGNKYNSEWENLEQEIESEPVEFEQVKETQ